jgi:hypothetical protein
MLRPSVEAEALLAELATRHGLRTLAFDIDGLISMQIGPLELAISYSEANDMFFLFGIIDPEPDQDSLDAWRLFEKNRTLAERRTRFALEAETGALVLSCDIHVADCSFQAFDNAIERFAKDLGEEAEAWRKASEPVSSFDPSERNDGIVLFRA